MKEIAYPRKHIVHPDDTSKPNLKQTMLYMSLRRARGNWENTLVQTSWYSPAPPSVPVSCWLQEQPTDQNRRNPMRIPQALVLQLPFQPAGFITADQGDEICFILNKQSILSPHPQFSCQLMISPRGTSNCLTHMHAITPQKTSQTSTT